jgi:HEAT repeat protein
LRRLLRAAPLLAALLLAGPRLASGGGPAAGKLASTDPVTVFQGIEEAIASKDPANAGDLLSAGWQTATPYVAVGCGDALRAIGPAAAASAEYQTVLAKATKGKDPRGQKNLARVLGAYGDPSVDEHLAWLASGRRPADVQTEALYACGSLPVTGEAKFEKCLQAVLAGIKSKSGGVQMAACSAAGRLKSSAFKDALEDVASHSQHEYAGLYAVRALRAIGVRGGLRTYVHVLGSDAKRETQNACLKAITDLSGPDDVDELLSLSRSPKKDIRDAACIALGNLSEPGGGLAPVITPTEGAPPAAIPVSEELGKVIDRLLELVATDTDWEVRDAASRAVLKIGAPATDKVRQTMPPIVDSPERDVALTAIELCGEFTAKEAAKDLTKIAIYDKDPVRRMFAARALSALDPVETTAQLLESIGKDHKGRDQTLNMITALGYLRHEAAYKGLIGMISTAQDWSAEILSVVERSLERLTGRRFGRRAERWDAWYAKVRDKDPFHFHREKFDRTQNRREAVTRGLYGLTQTTEKSVEWGLRWIEDQQHPEGFWDGNDRGFAGVPSCEPAYTGLAVLALLGAGYDGKSGRYRETIRRGVEFLAASQFYDGGYPVTGGGDSSWIIAYLIGMGVWGVNEAFAMSGDETLRGPSQRGIDYLVRTQTPGAGWRYGPRYTQSDSSCTAWVLMTMKTASLAGLRVAQKAYDGVDYWYQRCQLDITGEDEVPEDLTTDYEKEVGVKRYFKAFTGYFTLSGSEASSLQQTSMTAVGMVCRFFMGWQRSHPFLIGSANYLMDFLPQWRKGLEKGQAIAWYFYFYYYGTLAMYQMGGRYWRAWNEKIKAVLPENQRTDPPALAGSWDPDTALLNGGRLYATCMAVMTLETYYRFSPLLPPSDEDAKPKKKPADGAAMDGAAMDSGGMGDGTPPPAPDATGMDGK